MSTCSLLWLPVVYYDYMLDLPSVLPSHLYTVCKVLIKLGSIEALFRAENPHFDRYR